MLLFWIIVSDIFTKRGESMKIWMIGSVFLMAACAASGSGEKSVCDEMCNELYGACDYAAFPDKLSCMEGCLYAEENDADVEGQKECVLDAACDTFAIIECENTYGVEANE